MPPRRVVLLALLVHAAVAEARPVPDQAQDVPLATGVTEAEIADLDRAFSFGRFDLARVVALRETFLGRAQAGDPVAQFLYARTFDLFEVGQGTPEGAKTALEWYQRAADQKYASAELFLHHVYRYSLLQVPEDRERARAYLERARRHAAGHLRVQALLELAHGGDTIALLEEAHRIEPTDGTTNDWLYAEYAQAGKVEAAIAIAGQSANPTVLAAAGKLCVERRDLGRALPLLRRAAAGELAAGNDAEMPALMLLYQLVCQKKLTRANLGALYQQRQWDVFTQWQKDCVFQSGG
jgi:hypothetical protein